MRSHLLALLVSASLLSSCATTGTVMRLGESVCERRAEIELALILLSDAESVALRKSANILLAGLQACPTQGDQ